MGHGESEVENLSPKCRVMVQSEWGNTNMCAKTNLVLRIPKRIIVAATLRGQTLSACIIMSGVHIY